MASTIKQEVTAEIFKNAKYVLADQDKFLYNYVVENGDESYIFIDLMDIDLDNDIPSDFFHGIEKVYTLQAWEAIPGQNGYPFYRSMRKGKVSNL